MPAKKVVFPDKYVRKIKEVKDFLKSKGVYEDIDQSLVEELVFNLYLCETARADIFENGITILTQRSNASAPSVVQNPSVVVYQQAIKTINAISTKLGMNIQERTKLKLTTATIDELDKMLD